MFEVEDEWDARGVSDPDRPNERDEGREEFLDLAATFLGQVLFTLGRLGYEAARPPVERWWRDTAAPAVRSTPGRVKSKFTRPRRSSGDDGVTNSEPTVQGDPAPSGPSSGDDRDIEVLGPTMTAAEARELLATAVMATAFAKHQMRLLRNVRIVDDDADGPFELAGALDLLSPQGVEQAVRAVIATDPSILSPGNLAAFGLSLGTGQFNGERLPSRVRAAEVAGTGEPRSKSGDSVFHDPAAPTR